MSDLSGFFFGLLLCRLYAFGHLSKGSGDLSRPLLAHNSSNLLSGLSQAIADSDILDALFGCAFGRQFLEVSE